MQGEVQGGSAERDRLGRYKPGYSSRRVKLERIAAKLNELVAEYFPNGGYSRMDAARLKLAAQHFVDAETCRDPVTRQRATRCGEYLLSKLKPPSAPCPPAADQAAQALALLFNKKPPDGDDVGVVEETIEQKLKRHEDALAACMVEIQRLRIENTKLRSEKSDALSVCQSIYNDPDAPLAIRTKAAAASLPFERPKLMPERAPLELTAEPAEQLAAQVERQRARMNRLLSLPLEQRSELITGVSGNGSDDSSD